jgi:hypothetical protein
MGQASRRGTKEERVIMATSRNKQELERKLEELRALNARVESFPKGAPSPHMLGVALMAANSQYHDEQVR